MDIFDYTMIALGIGLIFSLICLVYIHARLHKDLQGTGKYGLELFDQPLPSCQLWRMHGPVREHSTNNYIMTKLWSPCDHTAVII